MGPGAVIAVENPATGEEIGQVPDLSAEQVEDLARRGRVAQPAWEALGFDGRGRVLRRAQRWLVDNQKRVIETICAETGKAYEDALIAEVLYGQAAYGFWAKMAPKYLADERVRSGSVFVKGKRLVLRYRPLGLIGVIGPWNYPLTNSFGDCIPALAAGNSVLLKPATATPLTSLLLTEGLRESGLPDDVLQVVTGRGGAVGDALVDAVDMVMFTGSTEVGKGVMARASETVTPVSLELGGKDPFIVLADADIDRAAHHAVYYSMFNGGQTCISVERVYVEEPVYDEFVAKVSEQARKLRQGVPAGPGSVDIGAITTPGQLETVAAHVDDAVAKGARVIVGGGRGGHSNGTWYEPTVLVDVDHSMECMTEETFGPTLPIMKVRDAEEAIQLANDSPFGLNASVFSTAERGEAVARRLESGAVCVNDALLNYTALELPMGGAKTSGLGHRHGPGGIRKYCQQQSLLISKVHLTRDFHTYPYKAPKTRLLTWLSKLLYGRRRREH